MPSFIPVTAFFPDPNGQVEVQLPSHLLTANVITQLKKGIAGTISTTYNLDPPIDPETLTAELFTQTAADDPDLARRLAGAEKIVIIQHPSEEDRRRTQKKLEELESLPALQRQLESLQGTLVDNLTRPDEPKKKTKKRNKRRPNASSCEPKVKANDRNYDNSNDQDIFMVINDAEVLTNVTAMNAQLVSTNADLASIKTKLDIPTVHHKQLQLETRVDDLCAEMTRLNTLFIPTAFRILVNDARRKILSRFPDYHGDWDAFLADGESRLYERVASVFGGDVHVPSEDVLGLLDLRFERHGGVMSIGLMGQVIRSESSGLRREAMEELFRFLYEGLDARDRYEE